MISNHIIYAPAYNADSVFYPTGIQDIVGFEVIRAACKFPSGQHKGYKLEYRIGDLATCSSYNGQLTMPFILMTPANPPTTDMVFVKTYQKKHIIPKQNIKTCEFQLRELGGSIVPLEAGAYLLIEINLYHEKKQC